MNFENNKPNESQENRTEDQEVDESFAEMLIEASLLHGGKFDEGQNAIVMEVDPKELTPEIRDYFFGADKTMPDQEFVSKVLKIYTAGFSEEEASHQEEARQIIANQPPEIQTQLAKVPETYIHRDIQIHTAELKEKMEANGIRMSGDRVGVILMYRVQGVDFLNYLLREAIKRASDEDVAGSSSLESAKSQLASSPKDINSEEIFKAATIAASLERSDKLALSKNNRNRLLDYLQKRGFVLDSEILGKIERTIKVLNENNFYHNDLTERNVMVELDEEGNVTDVYIIDFEKSSATEDENFGGDMAILAEYKPLTKSGEQKRQEVIDKDIEMINKLATRVAKAKPKEYGEIKSFLQQAISSIKNQNSFEIRAEISADSLLGDQSHELLAAILLGLAEDNSEMVKDYIEQRIKDTKINTRFYNLLIRVKNKL